MHTGEESTAVPDITRQDRHMHAYFAAECPLEEGGEDLIGDGHLSEWGGEWNGMCG